MGGEQLDILRIRDLLVRAIIGVYPEERRNRQDLLITISLYADLRKACKSDRLEDSVDYKAVKQKVLSLVEASQFNLIERLAESVAEVCLEDRRVQKVQVTIEKPGALRFARCSEIEIVRERPAGRSRQRSGMKRKG